MLRFLSVAFILLLATAPTFFSTKYFVIESITDEIIKLESLDCAQELKQKYVQKKAFPELKEGDVVLVKMIGDWPYSITPDPSKTHERQIDIAELLSRIQANRGAYSQYD